MNEIHSNQQEDYFKNHGGKYSVNKNDTILNSRINIFYTLDMLSSANNLVSVNVPVDLIIEQVNVQNNLHA